MLFLTIILIFGLAAVYFVLASRRARTASGGNLSTLHSRPNYHGLYASLRTLLAGGLVLLVLWVGGSAWIEHSILSDIAEASPEMREIEHELVYSDAKAISRGNVASASDDLRLSMAEKYGRMESIHLWLTVLGSLGAALVGGGMAMRSVSQDFRARNKSESIISRVLWVSAAIAVLTTIGIVMSLIFETITFFNNIGWRIDKFLFGTRWSPLSGVQEGAMDPEKVGAVPLFTGTFLITAIAMLVAVPIGLFAAIYLSEFADRHTRAWAKPMLEILAGIPTVVYGFFAAITVAPFIRRAGEAMGMNVASESALAAGVVMGIMIIPFISSLSDDVINSVPQSLRDGSYGLGATRAETIRQVVLPAALPGIVSAVLLGVSRAVGETMIVVMAAGQGANLTFNPLEAVTTVTVQIVMLITGDTEATVAAGPAFTLGFTLFCITLLLNIIALRIVRRYRELYD
jgi:phosphate transport system permease protein